MTRLTLPTTLVLTLFVSAWAVPAGPTLEIITAKTAAASADDHALAQWLDARLTLPRGGAEFLPITLEGSSAPASPTPAPAETTEDVLTQDESAPIESAQAAPEETTLASEPIRLPPRRAVPKELVCETLAAAAASNDVPAPFFIRLIWRESGFNQNAVSPVGAQGVAQFMPATAAQHRLADPFDPLQALQASARMLRNLIQQFGNVGLAAAAYNAGPGRVSNWLAGKNGKLPQETRDYVQNITGKAPEHWRKVMAAAPIRIPAAAPCQREAGLLAANGPAKIPMPPLLHTASVETKKSGHGVKIADKTASEKPAVSVAKPDPAKPATKTAAKTSAKPKATKTAVANSPGKPLTLAANAPAPARKDKSETKRDAKRDNKGERKRIKVAEAPGK